MDPGELDRLRELVGKAKSAIYDLETAMPEGQKDRREVRHLRILLTDLSMSMLTRLKKAMRDGV